MKTSAKKILIIEDRKDILAEMIDYFTECGYAVLAAKNNLDAFKLLKSKLPDLVITETLMPGIDGFQFLKNFRKLPGTAFIPVIFLSTKIDGTMLKKILFYNVNNYLKIPFRITVLNRMVQELLTMN